MTKSTGEERIAEGISFSSSDLRKLVIPLVAEQLLAIAVGLADSLMVAGISNEAVSAVSLIDSLSAFIIYLFAAFAAGGAVVAGQYLGRRDEKKARRAAEQLVVLLAGVALAMMAVFYVGEELVLRSMFGKVEPTVMENAQRYYHIVMGSLPFIALYNGGTALMRAMQRSDVTFRISLLMNGFNVCGNALLIYGFGMGVEGAAIPTLVSRAAAAVVILAMFRDPTLVLHLREMRHYRPDGRLIKNILSIGVPSGLENGVFHFGRLALTSLISTFGTASIMANAIGNVIGSFHIFASGAIGLAMTAVVSRCVGAGDYAAARKYNLQLLRWCYLLQGSINLALLLATPLVLRAYHAEGETAWLGAWVLIIHCICATFFYPTSSPLANTLRAAGDARFTMLVTVFTICISRVAAGHVLGRFMGLGVIGVYLAYTLDCFVRSVIFVHRYRGTKWQHEAVK